MTFNTQEIELMNGARQWDTTQALFQGPVIPTRTRYSVDCHYYGTEIDENEGSFAMIQAGSDLEELVGEYVRVVWRNKIAFLYVVGGAPITTPFAMARAAFLRFTSPGSDPIRIAVQPVQVDT